MRRLEKPPAILICAGECPFHITEQLGFQKRFRERSAIDGDEGSRGARAIFVNGSCNKFFPCPAFSR